MDRKVGWLVTLAACGCSVEPLVTSRQSSAERLFALSADWPAFMQASPGQAPRGAIDILFMVDNSATMGPLQRQLAAAFSAFIRAIGGNVGGMLDLHIGVVSPDLGVGDDSLASCDGRGGDRGVLQAAPRGSCTETNLARGARYMTLQTGASGEPATNHPGSASSEVFGCIALLGEGGCGYEQPLAAVKRALDPVRPPAENVGFLRRDAFLAVIIVSNEDDCSAAPGFPLFDTTENRNVSSALGPPTSFRCNEFGHLCDGARPPRTATGEMTDCVSNDAAGYLESVSGFVAFLRGLKDDPAKVFVASLAGPPKPYRVQLRPAPVPDTADWPEIGHSCTGADGTFADPAVRLGQLSETLGVYGHFESICGDSMNTPLQRIAAQMTRPLARACVTRPAAPEACVVVDRWVDGDGVKHANVIPRCSGAGAAPCWSLSDDTQSCPAMTEQRLQITRDASPLPDGLMTAIGCPTAGAP